MTTKFNYTARQALCFAHRIHDDGTSSLVRACACLLAATRPTAMSMHTPRFTNRSASSRPLQPLHLNFDEQCEQNTYSARKDHALKRNQYILRSLFVALWFVAAVTVSNWRTPQQFAMATSRPDNDSIKLSPISSHLFCYFCILHISSKIGNMFY